MFRDKRKKYLMMQKWQDKFGIDGRFVRSDLNREESVFDPENKGRITDRALWTLRKNGWLKSKETKPQNMPNNRFFQFSKRAKDYLRDWGRFDNPKGPLMQIKPKVITEQVEKKQEIVEEVTGVEESYEFA